MTFDIVVVGAGPTGLTLACELRLAGADPLVLDRLPEPSTVPKANGLGGQVVRMLDHRGLLERFTAAASHAGPVPAFPFGGLPLDLSRLEADPFHLLLLPQPRMEEILGERARELGVTIRRGHELLSFTQDDPTSPPGPADGGGVTLRVRGPEGDYEVRTRYLVGCDGARSLVRRQAGIGFPGSAARETTLLGRVVLAESAINPKTGEVEVPGVGRVRPGRHATPHGAFTITSLHPGVHLVGVHLPTGADTAAPEEPIGPSTRKDPAEPAAPEDPAGPLAPEELRAAVRRELGADLPIERVLWSARVVPQARQADRYREGRVLLAGDAAHLFPAGGALAVCLPDAVNLGWKLAAHAGGWAPPGLLDTYQTERHPAGRRFLTQARVQALLTEPGEDAAALRGLLGELLGDAQAVRRVAGMMSGSDLCHDMPGAAARPHPLLGRFVPGLRLVTSSGATGLAELMRTASPLLLDLAGRTALTRIAAGWRDRVVVVPARCEDPPADALLVRPDGHVAWVAAADEPDEQAGDALRTALSHWFGAETRAEDIQEVTTAGG
ncbi:FAD-dependent monooxygenase [Sphaerisporangium corydalis]|uniref:FAD-dependent monooxygenase n=1 Tax=Sphaerisporangium corydalis TaxID=1441875 RepID=A0ABV9ENG9_9ACTN|nr:FAD-dependent monooxygenase [Sphaerisporangium corydalis]